MSETYPTSGSEQNPQQPVQKMVRDEHGNFVMQAIDFIEADVVRQASVTEPVAASSMTQTAERVIQEVFTPDELAFGGELLSEDDASTASSDSEKIPKARRQKNTSKERAPLSVADKLYRAVGLTTLAAVGWVGVAGASNYAAAKFNYGIDIGYRQQLDTATKLPDKIDQDIERLKKAIDFVNFFNMKEVTGDSHD